MLNTSIKRHRASMLAMLITVALVGFSTMSSVQAQQVPPAVGATAWSNNGWLYQWNGTGWAITQWSRIFPDANNGAVWDTYASGQLYTRVDLSRESGWVHEYYYASKSWVKQQVGNTDPNAAYGFLPQYNQWFSAPQLQALIAQLQQQQAQQQATAEQQALAAQASAAMTVVGGVGSDDYGYGHTWGSMVIGGVTEEEQRRRLGLLGVASDLYGSDPTGNDDYDPYTYDSDNDGDVDQYDPRPSDSLIDSYNDPLDPSNDEYYEVD